VVASITPAHRLTVGTELANAELSMSDLSDAIKALENDAQYLRDNLTNLDDPPTNCSATPTR